MSNLSSADVKHLSKLARLNLTEAEQTQFAKQLSSVIAYVEQLGKVDTHAVQQLAGMSGQSNVFAADEPRAAGDLASVNSVDLLANTPSTQGHLIQVRAVLTDGV